MPHTHHPGTSTARLLVAVTALALAGCQAPDQPAPAAPTAMVQETAIVELFPFTASGELADGWVLDSSRDEDPAVECRGGSPHARSGETTRCGSDSDAAQACWAIEGDLLYCLDETDPEAHRVYERRGFRSAAKDPVAPDPTANPRPIFIELADGSRWGPAATRGDDQGAEYRCIPTASACAGAASVTDLDTSTEPWTAAVTAAPDAEPESLRVAQAWFIKGWGSPEGQSGDASSIDGTIDDHGTFDLGSVERWLADTAARDRQRLISNCWTFAPESVVAMYLDSDLTALHALMNSGPPSGAQYGVFWPAAADGHAVHVFWKEVESPYACPVVEGPSVANTTRAQAVHVVTRLLRRASGRPVNRNDTPEQYFLGCEELSNAHWDERTLYPRLRGHQVAGTERETRTTDWRVLTVRAGKPGPTFVVSSQDFGGCIRRVLTG